MLRYVCDRLPRFVEYVTVTETCADRVIGVTVQLSSTPRVVAVVVLAAVAAQVVVAARRRSTRVRATDEAIVMVLASLMCLITTAEELARASMPTESSMMATISSTSVNPRLSRRARIAGLERRALIACIRRG